MKILRILLIGATALCCLGESAQVAENAQVNNTKFEEKIEFRPHFFVQVQGGSAYTLGENTFGKLISPAAAVNVGYKFIPAFGLRLGASGWQAKGSWVAPRMDYSYNYVQGNLDAMLSLTNLFCGFNPKRTLDFYAFVGAGFNHAFNNDEAVKVGAATNGLEYLWNDSKNFVTGRGGLGLNIRLSDIVAVNVEVNANGMSDHFNSKKAGNPDWQFNGLVGFTFNLGKSYKKVQIPVEVEEEFVEEIVAQPVQEPVKVEEKVEKPKVVEQKVTIQRDVFFTINSAKIRESEQVKIDELVSFLNAHPTTKIVITGYADRPTGNTNYNMEISKKRAQAVADAIISTGISSDRVTVEARGDIEQPFAEQELNRVAICIAEK